jgi:hypothetical protein
MCVFLIKGEKRRRAYLFVDVADAVPDRRHQADESGLVCDQVHECAVGVLDGRQCSVPLVVEGVHIAATLRVILNDAGDGARLDHVEDALAWVHAEVPEHVLHMDQSMPR